MHLSSYEKCCCMQMIVMPDVILWTAHHMTACGQQDGGGVSAQLCTQSVQAAAAAQSDGTGYGF